MVGYAASLIVAVSLMMSSVLRLRIVNLAGALLFTVYGVAIGALPVAAVNGFVVIINSYYLLRMLRTREYFRILPVAPDSEYVRYFLERSDAEIRRFLPGFRYAPERAAVTCFVLRDLVPAGLFIGEREAGGTLRVQLDYVLPGYRDLKVGRYLFEDQAAFFRELGLERVVSEPGTPAHERYLRRMGFEPTPGGLLERRLP